MKEVHLAVFFTICICNVLLATGDIKGPQCFHYTWPGAGVTNNSIEASNNSKNTSNVCAEYEKFPNIPCISPFKYGFEKPNTSKLWDEIQSDKSGNSTKYLCRLERGNVCVRYTYMYNGAVMNVSYFCGKVIEDKTTVITLGCFVQYTEGYAIEACACQSSEIDMKPNMPCNSTRRNTYSILITFVATAVIPFIYLMFTPTMM